MPGFVRISSHKSCRILYVCGLSLPFAGYGIALYREHEYNEEQKGGTDVLGEAMPQEIATGAAPEGEAGKEGAENEAMNEEEGDEADGEEDGEGDEEEGAENEEDGEEEGEEGGDDEEGESEEGNEGENKEEGEEQKDDAENKGVTPQTIIIPCITKTCCLAGSRQKEAHTGTHVAISSDSECRAGEANAKTEDDDLLGKFLIRDCGCAFSCPCDQHRFLTSRLWAFLVLAECTVETAE
jgi:hypothetical protein